MKALRQTIPAPSLQRAEGVVKLGFKRRGANTVLQSLYQQGCAKARFPKPPATAPFEAIMINTSGGLTDGDKLRYDIAWREGTHACVTTQAAERLYRTRGRGAATRIDVKLRVDEDAFGEWLPQESLFFNGASLRRTLTIDMAGTARVLACESMIFGRAAMGETLTDGRLFERWQVRQDGQLVWHDAWQFDPLTQAVLDRPAIAGGATALASLVYIGQDAARATGALRAACQTCTSVIGFSLVPPVLLVRVVADSAALRADLINLVNALRRSLFACDIKLPRVWYC